jgi:hypothetical protein
VKLVGLTSANNLAFLRDVDLFDEAVGYDEVNLLPSTISTVFVDMSGNGTLLATLHRHFKDNITASIAVGATHWDAPRNREKLPGPAPSFFFAPGQMLKRESDWGPAEMMRRIEKANLAFLPKLQDMVQIEHHAGPEPERILRGPPGTSLSNTPSQSQSASQTPSASGSQASSASGTSSAGRTYSPGSMVNTMPPRKMRLGRLTMVSPDNGSLRSLVCTNSVGST